jgi:hypothetical protein
MYTAFKAARLEKPQSGCVLCAVLSPPHFFAPVKILRIFPYQAKKKRHLQSERYATNIQNMY